MGDRVTVARAEAIEGFATVLSELRDSADRPSFRVMAGRSRVISHTTLHEAAQGCRLPSWGTTVEFVKACGADPKDYRERWEQANRAVSSSGTTCPVPGPALRATSAAGRQPQRPRVDVPVDRLPETQGAPDNRTASPPVPAPRAGRRGWYALLGVVVVGLLAAGVGVAWSLAGPPADRTPAASPPHVAADCPVRQQNPPAAVPEHPGDRAAFIADLTLPDCSHVHRGRTLPKVWRLKNVGTVAWKGYTLHRIDLPQGRDQCQTIADVPIADTPPGQTVDGKVEITMPSSSGFCFVRFKMMDASGKVAFPGSRPVYFQVIVD